MVPDIAWQCPLLAAVGVVAGVLNVIAGGGSMLTLPLLIFMGLPSATANGTNRVAILCQNVVAVRGFRKQGVFPAKLAFLCTGPALVGSYFGARMAVNIDDQLFNRVLAVIMVCVLVLTLVDPARRWQIKACRMTPLRTGVLLLSFFGIGIYGGCVQAGVGFFIISALLVHGLDLVRINAVKVFVIVAFNIVALVVFMGHGQVNYVLGFSLAAGNSIGGWIGSHLAVKKGHDWIRKIVFLMVLVFAVKLLVW